MKPFLCIDITNDRKSTYLNGEEFITCSTSTMQTDSLAEAMQKASSLEKIAYIPAPLRILRISCKIIGIIGSISLVRALIGSDSVSLETAYQNAPWLFWLIGVTLAIWLILSAFGQMKKDRMSDSEEDVRISREIERISAAIYSELCVPDDARNVDILSFCYKQKKKGFSVKARGLALTEYINFDYKLYLRNDCLCLTNLEHTYSFPLSELRAIRTVKKQIAIPRWNKEISFKDGNYLLYKITSDQYNRIFFKPYHILELEHNGELWGIYFPCYERPAFERLTGLRGGNA